MFYVYILYSSSIDKYYTGQTDSLESRLNSHLAKISPYTRVADDWKLVYSESFDTRTAALKRENAIKKKKSRKYIEWLIIK